MNKNWNGLIRAGMWLVYSASVAALIAGCSGSSSDTPPPAPVLISGTAAAGAPVVGFVSVRDSSTKTQPVKEGIAIEANGHYSVDVTGLTPPYAFLATGTVGGKTVSLYSAATSDDAGKTINITPFTDLIIRNIAAGAVDTYLATSGNMANLTTAELDVKRVVLTAQLAPALLAMGVSGSIDLLRATFNADASGLDRFMDAIKVDTTTPGSVTISNIMDAATTLVVNTAAGGTATGSIPTSTLTIDPIANPTPLDQLVQGFKALSDLFATSLPAVDNASLLSLFHVDFMNNGDSRAVMLTDLTTSTPLIGAKFTNIKIDSIDLTPGSETAVIHFTPVSATGVLLNTDSADGSIKWQMKKVGSVWQAYGNRRLAWVKVRTIAIKGACNPLSTTCFVQAAPFNLKTGLALEVEKKVMTVGVGYAVVKGAGLPTANSFGGVKLDLQLDYNTFKISPLTPNTTDLAIGSADRCTEYVLCNWNHWLMYDTEIATVATNSVYTVELWSNATPAVLMASYTETVPVAPVLNTALATKAFPSLTGMVNLAGIGGTLTPSWSVPAGLKAQWMNAYVWQNATPLNFNASAHKGLNGVATGTATLVVGSTASVGSTGNWSGGNYSINATDQYGGMVSTFYE